MILSTTTPRAMPEAHDEVFDRDYGLGGPGEGIAFDDTDNEHREAPVTVTHGVTYLPLISLTAYQTIACVQAGAAHGRRVVLWTADRPERGATDIEAACLLIEVINLRDAVTLGCVADQLRALLGPAHVQGIRDPRSAVSRSDQRAGDRLLPEP